MNEQLIMAGLNGMKHGSATNEKKADPDLVRAAILNNILPLTKDANTVMVHWHHLCPTIKSMKTIQQLDNKSSQLSFQGIIQRHSFSEAGEEHSTFEVIVTEIIPVKMGN